MSLSVGSKLQLTPGSITEQLFNVGIGIVGGCYYTIFQLFRDNKQIENPNHYNNNSSLFVSSKRNKTLKVAGVGFGRTGTFSLKLALDELGISTFHANDALAYQSRHILQAWLDDLVLPSIESKTAILGKMNLDLLVQSGFEGTADFPNALYYEQILQEYPDCKFILTTRESSEAWFKSWNALVTSLQVPTNYGAYMFSSRVSDFSLFFRWIQAHVNTNNDYLTESITLPAQNKTAAIRSYEQHNERVRSIIPSKNLLEFDVTQGWEPLCQFLEIEHCPTTPFPKTHSSSTMYAQSYTPIVLMTIAVAVVLHTLTKVVAKKFIQKKTETKKSH